MRRFWVFVKGPGETGGCFPGGRRACAAASLRDKISGWRDLLIYNGGVLHDESANPNEGMSVYCCAFTNLKLRGLPKNTLSRGRVLIPTGERHGEFDSLFGLLHAQIRAEHKLSLACSPIQYLIRRRIGEAQTLLINTGLSVTDIALMVGYDNPNYFNTAFRKVVGIPPGRYRRQYLK